MHRLDRFDPQLALADWLFALALGLCLGVFLSGAWLVRKRSPANAAPIAVVALSVMSAGIVALSVFDAGRLQVVEFRLKPFLTESAEALGLVFAVALGALVSIAIIVSLLRGWKRDAALVPAVALCFVAAAMVLWGVDLSATTRGRHPNGTDTTHLVASTSVIGGLEIPVGLAVAPNGDIATIELEAARLRLFVPNGSSFVQKVSVPLPVETGRFGLHVAFHPEYPAQPYVYVTAEDETSDGRFMELLRGHIRGDSVEFAVLVSGMPVAIFEESGDHFGSAIAICGDSLFVSTGDTEAQALFFRALDANDTIRDDALSLASPRGKILRWRLSGADLTPNPVAMGEFPMYAYGFRNPFGMTCDAATGWPIVSDNGNVGHDQLRLVPPGSNHEWPLSQERNTLSKPLFDSGNSNLAPTGVAYRDAPDGHELVFSTFASRALYLLPVPNSGKPGRLRLLTEVESGAYAVAADRDGCVYYTDAESVRRLEDGRCAR